MKRAAIYVRVSHEEQKKHGLSVDSQLQALTEYCDKNNYKIAGVYNDAGISARKKYTKRPALLQLLEDCKQNKIDLILFTKLDRWFRSVADYYEVQTVLDQFNIPWKAIWEDYDTITANGVLKVNIMLSVAQSEADRTSERIKSVFEYKKSQGDYIGSACLGYKRENKKLVKDEATAPIIEELFNYFFVSWSVTATHKHLKEIGYPLHKDTVRDILKKETYCGNANGYECYAYITWEEHNRIIEKISSRTCKQTADNYDYVFSGMIKCGLCGRYMYGRTTFNKHKDGSKIKCRYYVCDAKAAGAVHTSYQSISELKMEKYLMENLDKLILAIDADATNPKKKVKDNSRKIEMLQDKLKRIGIRFEDGDLSVEEYRSKRDSIQKEIKELQKDTNVGSITPLIIPSNWQTIYETLDPLHKRAFWRSYIDYIIYTNETKSSPRIVFRY